MRLSVAVLLVGCGAADVTPEIPADSAITDSQTLADTHSSEEPAPSTYPPGPYGTMVDDAVTDLALEGYVRTDTTGLATSAPYGPSSFGMLRASTTRKYALVHVSGFT